MRFCIGFLFLFLSSVSQAQKKTSLYQRKNYDENENPLSKVTITILGNQTGTLSTDSGTFNIKVPADRALALIFSFAGYRNEQRNFYLSENEKENLIIKLERGGRVLETVLIQDKTERNETGPTK